MRPWGDENGSGNRTGLATMIDLQNEAFNVIVKDVL